MTMQERLLSEIDTFLSRSGMKETTFGRLSVNDGKLVGRLRNGASITLGTAEKIGAFIGTNRRQTKRGAR